MINRDGIMNGPIGFTDDVLPFENSFDGSRLLLLTPEEVAKVLKISLTGVRRLQQQRLIPFLKVGGSLRFLKEDIFAYLMKQRVKPIE